MGKKIKLIPARMESLWIAMNREQQRLQAAAAAVARIAAALEMDVAAKANIDASLAALQKKLKQQAANMQTMQQLAQMAASEMDAQDAALAKEAKGVVYNAQQTAAAGAMLSNPQWNGTRGGLNLSAMANVDMLSHMTALLGPQPGIPLDTLNGVSLTTLLKQELGATDTRMTDAFVASCMKNPVYQLAGLGLVAGTTREGMDVIAKPKSTGKSKKTSQPQQEAGFFQWGKDAVNKIGSKVSKGAEEVQKKAKEAKKWAEEKLEKGWKSVKKTAKDISNNKYVKKYTELYGQGLAYSWELTGDVLTVGGDIVGFASSCVSGQPLDMVSDCYSFVNDCFTMYQDGEAMLEQIFGTVHTVLGNEEEAARWFADAAASSEREGVADEFYHGGLDEIGAIVEVVDGVNVAYKTYTGFDKFVENAGKIGTALFDDKNFAAAKELILEQTGWKIPDVLGEDSALADIIGQKKDVAGNIGLAYKYIDGILEGDFFETFLDNTGLGKPVGKVVDAKESFEEFIERLMGIAEKNSKK